MYLFVFNILIAIDSKSDMAEDNSEKGGNFGVNDLENCLDLIKNKKILRGIDNFRLQKVDVNKRFIDIAKMVDNNVIYILLTILLIIISLFSISAKKDVSSWSEANWKNKILLDSFSPTTLSTMGDYLNYLSRYISLNNSLTNPDDNEGFIFYGPAQFRFIKTQEKTCSEVLASIKGFQDLLKFSNVTCYYADFMTGTYNMTDVYNYSFQNNTNISRQFSTPVGFVDTPGVIIDIYPMDSIDYQNKMQDIFIIANESNGWLTNQVQGIELSFTLYDPNKDVFLSNLILVQRDINQNPIITVADCIPFITNVYETPSGQEAYGADIFRIILLFLLLTSIPIRIWQKYTQSDVKGCTALLKLIFVVTLQLKNIFIFFSLGFLLGAYANFSSAYINSLSYFNSEYSFDFYYFAANQKEARAYDILSLFLITLYSLKYLQYLESVQILFIAFKKAAFEYFVLLVTISVLFFGLSILTNFVFGGYMFEYKNFLDSLTMNIKIFIFIENTSVTNQFLTYYRVFSIFVLIIFIFLIRYYLLNLFYPIFIEYYRIEMDKFNLSKNYIKDQGADEDLKFRESINFIYKFILELSYFLFACQKDKRKNKKSDGMVKEVYENNAL